MKFAVCFFGLLCIFFAGCNLVNKPQDARVPPWEEHGVLKISDNGHFLCHEDGTPFFWLGGTAWGMSEWLNREEVNVYLDNRKKLGFTVVQICLLWGKRHDDPVRFPINAPNAYGHRALKYNNDIPDPSQPDTIQGGSPFEPNDYWDHVDYIIEAAGARGMYVALLPVWGRRYVNASHQDHAQSIFTLTKARDYGIFLGHRYLNKPNIIWVLGGDVGARVGGDFRNHYRSMAEGIIHGLKNVDMGWAQKSSTWDAALMTYHPDGRPMINSSAWFHKDPWLDFNMIETHIWRDSVYQAVTDDYSLVNPVKPTIMAEGHYEGYTHLHLAEAIHIRRQAYQTFFAGGAGHTYGAGRDNLKNGPLFSPYTGWQQLLDLEGVHALPFLKEYLLNNGWPGWIPNNGIFENNPGRGELRKTAVFVPSVKTWIIYFPENTSAIINVKHLHPATINKGIWTNPKTTKSDTIVISSDEGIIKLTPPIGWEDALIKLSF